MKKVILVTGANRGIGFEIVKQLAQLGHHVIMGSRDLEKGKKAASALSGNVQVVKLEVTNPNDINKARKFIDKEYHRLDVLINNAGIGVGNKGAVDPNFAEIKRIMETNFYGAWYVIDTMLELLYKSKDARIINMSSGMGAIEDMKGGYAGYRLSKSSLNVLTLLLAIELQDKGVKVNTMCPGWVQTDMGGTAAPRKVAKGAETAVWLATDDDIPTGKFLRDKAEIAF